MNISKFFKQKYGKGDFSIVDDKLVYETKKGNIIEANLPNESNKSIKNDMQDEEVKDMPKEEKKEDKKEDLDKQKNAGNMDAKYVKLGENYDEPDPEVMEAHRKHIDMKEDATPPEKKKKKIPDDGAEAGEMEAETPEHKKKKKGSYDFMEELKTFKEDMTSKFETLEKENEKLKKDITDLNKEKNAEKEQIQEQLIADMSDKYMVPTNWLKEKAKKYEKSEDFVQDFYEGLSFAFGTLPGNEIEAFKQEDMKESRLLSKVSGLGIEANFSKEG